MKTDMQLKNMVNHMIQLRTYDDDMSIIIRLKIIKELNMQIKNILIHRHAETEEIDYENNNTKMHRGLDSRVFCRRWNQSLCYLCSFDCYVRRISSPSDNSRTNQSAIIHYKHCPKCNANVDMKIGKCLNCGWKAD